MNYRSNRAPVAAAVAFATFASQGFANVLEEIIVTAQHRQETAQSVGLALSVVAGDELVNAGVSDTLGLSRMVPALAVQPSGGSTVSFYLRGVGSLQGNAFGENAVGYYFNGVYVSRAAAPVGSFYDLERVEVLKGPQGTLYGRNATGGAITVLPQKPVLGELSGDLTGEFGNHDMHRAQGAVNIPLGDTTAMRMAFQVSKRDGYMSDGYDDEDGTAARLSWLAAPSDDLSVNVMADYFKDQSRGVGSVLATGGRVPGAPALDRRIGGSDPRSIGALTAFANQTPPLGMFLASGLVTTPRGDGYIDSEFYGLSAQIEYRISQGTFTLIPAYRLSKPEYLSYAPGFRGIAMEEAEQASFEGRFASEFAGPFNFVAGLYWFDESTEAENLFSQGLISTTFLAPRLDTESWALFGQGSWDLSDSLRLIAGVRYTEETREQSTRVATGNPMNPTPVPGEALPGELDFQEVTWKAGIEWDVAEDSLLYANVATGFKAGGFFAAFPPNNTFDPEELTAYTIGSKNTFMDRRLRLNAELFYWDYKDQQISFVGGIETPTGVGTGGVTVNAGEATIMGADVELQFALTPNTVVGANLQYLDAEYDELRWTAMSPAGSPLRTACATSNSRPANPGAPGSPALLIDVDCSGKPTINSPEVAANLTLEHSFGLGDFELIAGLRSSYETERYAALEFLQDYKQDSFVMTDLYAILEPVDRRWSVTAYVNNVGDETVKSGGFQRPVMDVSYVMLRPPRTFGIRGTVRF